MAVCLRAMSELWPPDPGACEVLWTPHARRHRVLPWWRLWCAAAPVVGHALMPLPGHQQNPWVLLSTPETSGALGALGALRRTSAPPGTRGVNMFPPEGSGESRRALESPRESSRRTLESSGASRST